MMLRALLATVISASQTGVASDPRAEQVRVWQADAKSLHDDLVHHHPEPFARSTPAEFAAARDDIIRLAPTMNWPQYVVAASRMIGLLKDGHSNLFPPMLRGPGFEGAYPVRLFQFSDGVYATDVGPGLDRLAGRRITAINGVPAEQAMHRLSEVVGGDNPLGRTAVAQQAAMVPGLLAGAGLGQTGAPLVLTVEDGPAQAAVSVEPVGWNKFRPGNLRPVTQLLAQSGGRAWFDEGPNIEMRRVGNGAGLLVTYRAVRDGEESIAAFSERLESELADPSVKRLIFDIRANRGGNNTLSQPLVHVVLRSPNVNRPGRLFVLIGRGTFSAAMNFATAMERETQALFVGEPTGAAPNHYGDAERRQLPSGLAYTRSTLLWQDSSPKDDRVWIVPDIPVPPAFSAVRESRDPALETALSFQAGDGPVIAPVLRWQRPSQEREWAAPAR